MGADHRDPKRRADISRDHERLAGCVVLISVQAVLASDTGNVSARTEMARSWMTDICLLSGRRQDHTSPFCGQVTGCAADCLLTCPVAAAAYSFRRSGPLHTLPSMYLTDWKRQKRSVCQHVQVHALPFARAYIQPVKRLLCTGITAPAPPCPSFQQAPSNLPFMMWFSGEVVRRASSLT